MMTCLDCIPCFLRQALEAARMVSADPAVHERIVRDVVRWIGAWDLKESPPVMARDIHRQIRAITGCVMKCCACHVSVIGQLPCPSPSGTPTGGRQAAGG